MSLLENKLNYSFDNRDMLNRALRHRSLSADHNERLEFLGDAFLTAGITEHLYKEYPLASEGALTQMRALLVRKEALTIYAQALSLAEIGRAHV